MKSRRAVIVKGHDGLNKISWVPYDTEPAAPIAERDYLPVTLRPWEGSKDTKVSMNLDGVRVRKLSRLELDGRKMKWLREFLGVTQRKLAAMIEGSSPGAIAEAELGRRPGLQGKSIASLQAYAAKQEIKLPEELK